MALFGFILYFLACAGVGYVAAANGRKGWLYALLAMPLGFALVIAGNLAGASSVGTGLLAFAAPAGLLVFLLSEGKPQARTS